MELSACAGTAVLAEPTSLRLAPRHQDCQCIPGGPNESEAWRLWAGSHTGVFIHPGTDGVLLCWVLGVKYA